jgi:hypothetical protein
MGYYNGKELEQDLTSACEELNRTFSDGKFYFDFYLDERSGYADCYIDGSGKIKYDDLDVMEDIVFDNVGSIVDYTATELQPDEYGLQIIVEYNPL